MESSVLSTLKFIDNPVLADSFIEISYVYEIRSRPWPLGFRDVADHYFLKCPFLLIHEKSIFRTRRFTYNYRSGGSIMYSKGSIKARDIRIKTRQPFIEIHHLITNSKLDRYAINFNVHSQDSQRFIYFGKKRVRTMKN